MNNNRKSTLNKNKNNLSSNSNTLRGKRVLTWERKSIDTKPQKKEKINNISINNNDKLEKKNSNSNYFLKKKNKILSSRPNSLLNNQRHSTINNTNNSLNFVKKAPIKKIEYYSNKLTFSNPNLM